MIDESSTLARFGYKSTGLSSCSGRSIVMVCEKCGRVRIGRKVDYRDRCNRCVERSTETREKISSALSGRHRTFTPEWRDNLKRAGIARRGKDNRSQGVIEAHRKAMTGKGNPRYGIPAAHGKRVHYHNGFIFRSSWELKVAEYFDRNSIRFEYEFVTYPVVYKCDGLTKDGTYTPDFYLPDTQEFIEVKGLWRDNAKQKYDAFVSQYPNTRISVWDKHALTERSII